MLFLFLNNEAPIKLEIFFFPSYEGRGGFKNLLGFLEIVDGLKLLKTTSKPRDINAIPFEIFKAGQHILNLLRIQILNPRLANEFDELGKPGQK